MVRLTAEQAHTLAVAALTARGVPQPDAAVVADSLVDAELEGQASHGLLRLPFLLRRLDAGLINPTPRVSVVAAKASSALIDADNGLGPVAGVAAIELAVAKARAAGCAVVAVRGSNHLGAMGFYVKRGAGADALTLGFSNTPPAMAPPGGRTRFLGTNPIACGIPTSNEPVVIDMATSQVARGRLLKAAASGTKIPIGWALDAGGRDTDDPRAGLDGSLVPLGGPKGFALSLIVEVLTGVLAGAAVGPEVAGTFQPSAIPSNVGHSFLAIDPEAFGFDFRSRMDRLAGSIRAVAAVDAGTPVRVPGDRRRQERATRQRDGIDVDGAVIREVEELTRSPGRPRVEGPI